MTTSNPLFLPLYQAYLKARKKKKPSYNQLNFESKLLENLVVLSKALMNNTWRPKTYTSFVALKPKARQIHAPDFSDRVVHHWLVPQLEAVFEQKFIYDSYANRTGKGTHQAVKRLQSFVRKLYSGYDKKTDYSRPCQGKGYYLQCDIANFFNSIHRPTLYQLIQQKISQLDNSVQSATYQLLTHSITANGVHQRASKKQLQAVPAHKKLENAQHDCGLPIGNLSSQFFANVYMNELDQYIKHTLKVRYYIRYVDDFVLLSHCQETLMQWLDKISAFLAQKLRLGLKKSPICKPIITGIDFLGFVIFPHHTQVRRRVVANLRHKLYQKQTKQPISIEKKNSFCIYFYQPCVEYYLHSNAVGYQQLHSVYASYLGHICHANYYRLLIKLYRDYPYLQRFHTKVKFDINSWFINRPIWLWTQLTPIENNSFNQPVNNQQEQFYANTTKTKCITSHEQAVQLCFDFADNQPNSSCPNL